MSCLHKERQRQSTSIWPLFRNEYLPSNSVRRISIIRAYINRGVHERAYESLGFYDICGPVGLVMRLPFASYFYIRELNGERYIDLRCTSGKDLGGQDDYGLVNRSNRIDKRGGTGIYREGFYHMADIGGKSSQGSSGRFGWNGDCGVYEDCTWQVQGSSSGSSLWNRDGRCHHYVGGRGCG